MTAEPSLSTLGEASTQPTLPAWMAEITGVVLDMDGVLFRGNTLIPEVPAFLAALDRRGIRWAMATNNSTAMSEDYVTKLAAMGVTTTAEHVITSGAATATWVRQRYAQGTRVFVVGSPALRSAVFADDYFVPAERDAEVVISGADFDLRYDSLRIACLAIRAGATWVATNADRTFPSEEGLIPGAGALVAALAAATDRTPTVIGKPGPGLVQSSMLIIGTPAEETLMIGDRLDTDILSGARAGCRTALVLTGVSTRADAETGEITPDLVVETLTPLTDFWSRSDGAA